MPSYRRLKIKIDPNTKLSQMSAELPWAERFVSGRHSLHKILALRTIAESRPRIVANLSFVFVLDIRLAAAWVGMLRRVCGQTDTAGLTIHTVHIGVDRLTQKG